MSTAATPAGLFPTVRLREKTNLPAPLFVTSVKRFVPKFAITKSTQPPQPAVENATSKIDCHCEQAVADCGRRICHRPGNDSARRRIIVRCETQIVAAVGWLAVRSQSALICERGSLCRRLDHRKQQCANCADGKNNGKGEFLIHNRFVELIDC